MQARRHSGVAAMLLCRELTVGLDRRTQNLLRSRGSGLHQITQMYPLESSCGNLLPSGSDMRTQKRIERSGSSFWSFSFSLPLYIYIYYICCRELNRTPFLPYLHETCENVVRKQIFLSKKGPKMVATFGVQLSTHEFWLHFCPPFFPLFSGENRVFCPTLAPGWPRNTGSTTFCLGGG